MYAQLKPDHSPKIEENLMKTVRKHPTREKPNLLEKNASNGPPPHQPRPRLGIINLIPATNLQPQ